MSLPDPKTHSHTYDSSHQFQRNLLAAFAAVEATCFSAGALIFRQDDAAQGVYLVEEGEVRLVIRSGDRLTAIRTASAGSLLGLSTAVTGQNHVCSAEAAQAARVRFLSRNQVLEIVRHDSQYCFEVVQLLANELLELSSGSLRAAHTPAKPARHPINEHL
ncbi:MAG TPA: cyclic nucleotide-binding domain-containing protein [Terriglobales bacterium]|nr:cyclic nucleotide-binding domain-containing protein [Terriglobales bacterium]